MNGFAFFILAQESLVGLINLLRAFRLYLTYILFGTYELLELTGLSAQLCRRSTYIHFSRYSNHGEADQIAFASMLESFQRHLPLAQPPDLLNYEDYLYEKTFGCIGVLKPC